MEEGFIERVFLSVIQIFGGGKRCRRGGSFIVSPYFCSVGEDFIERGPFYYCCHIFARKGRKFEGRNFVERWIMDIRLFLLFFFFYCLATTFYPLRYFQHYQRIFIRNQFNQTNLFHSFISI